MTKTKVGRPTLMNPTTLKKLEEAFAMGCSDKEACFYADISHQTLYNYQEKNPQFIERKEALKDKPILLARQSVIRGFAGDANLALKYLERRLPAEFGRGLADATFNQINLTQNKLTIEPKKAQEIIGEADAIADYLRSYDELVAARQGAIVRYEDENTVS